MPAQYVPCDPYLEKYERQKNLASPEHGWKEGFYLLFPKSTLRVLLNFEGEADRIDPDEILTKIMNDVPEPEE